MLKEKIIMRFAIGTIFLIFVMLPSVVAQGDGKIYQSTYSPTEPEILKDMTITIGAENSGNKTKDYFMQLQIIKDGRIVNEKEFTFSLEKTQKVVLTTTSTPEDIGEYQIIVKLYDKYKIDLFDTKIIKFNVISHIGPFDITIEPLTYRVRPGASLPAKLILENIGTNGTDVEVTVSIVCPEKTFIQSLTIFLGGNNRNERLINMQTCDQEGMYNIYASIMLLNKTLATSSSNFFVNSSFIQLQFDAPEKIILRPGETFTFPVEITNLGNQKISDLKFIIQRIPLEWQKISPSSIIGLAPNEKAVFIVNITVPEDAEQNSYEVGMTAIAEETQERKPSTLEITSSAVLPSTVSIFKTPSSIYIIISISLLTAILVFVVLRKRIKRVQSHIPPERAKTLKSIKERIRTKR